MQKLFMRSVLGLLMSVIGSTSVLAFNVDQLMTGFSPFYYKEPYPGSSSVDLYFSYGSGAIPTIGAGQSLRLRMLVPPGVSKVSIRGESNDWIGATCKQPVMATLSGEITGSCPYTTDGCVYSCGSVVMSPSAGGLSQLVYNGTQLSEARYMYFVLKNSASEPFSFGSLTVSMQVSCVDAYNAWRARRPWTGGSSPNQDGIGENYQAQLNTCSQNVAVPTPTNCPANPSLDPNMTVSIPLLSTPFAGFEKLKVNLRFTGIDGAGRYVFTVDPSHAEDFIFLP
jgi:hypothetical protein